MTRKPFYIASLLLMLVAAPLLLSAQRYKIALIDLMLLKRQKLGALQLTKDLGADGVEVDMGGLGKRPTFDNQLLNDTVRQQYLNKIRDLHIEIPSLAMTGYYAQSFCEREEYQQSIADCIKTMQLMDVKIAFLPMGVQCDLVKHPELRAKVVERLREAGKMAEAAKVVIGIETPLSAAEQLKLLREIGSPAIRIYFNVADAIGAGRDVTSELKTLGRKNICQIHITNKDGVWLENDPQVDMPAIKKTLDKMKWKGWLVVERSRDAKQPTNVKVNYGANTKYLKSVFQ
ncbi:sugar phosphate isomerase/epimerase family protein [Paraflavitalea pollutisoli]|uniref:sugar phosphate isomerase/epimerase family protein n=1 Tax=Paraflavitalea pollutisoli TaxID=3034143 RepID=UPI0023EC4542|nr:sugar phosphate isomerase/epimerase family protein [Paraflavitalea sp. H1-2-19X]